MSTQKKKVSLSAFLTKDKKEDSKKGDSWGDHDEGHEEGHEEGAGVQDYGYELSDDDEKPKKSYSRQEKPREERKTYEKREVPQVQKVDDSKLPTEGPYVAYVGNLSFDVTEQSIADFFGDSIIEDIKLITDRETGKFKGFGYVTFYKVEGLKHALSLSGQDLLHRAVRVDVSERKEKKTFERSERKGGFGDKREGGFGGFEKREPREPRGGFERREERQDVPKTDADVNNNWRKKSSDYVKPIPKPFEKKEETKERREPRHFEKRQESGSQGSDSRVERKPLNLAPRTEKPKDDSVKKSSENPFGEGKAWEPKDTVKKIEEKVEKELEERRKKHHGDDKHHDKTEKSSGFKKFGSREDDGFEKIKKNESGGHRRFDNKKREEGKKDEKKPEHKEEKKPTQEKKVVNKFDVLNNAE